MIKEYIEQKILVDENGVECLSPLRTRRKRFISNEILDVSAEKKEVIIETILSESDQLNLLAAIVEQIGDAIALDTPEYIDAKAKYAKIKKELAK